MPGYNYSQYVSTIAGLMPKSPSDPDFVTMLPNAIDYAEQRIYRELDLLNTVFRDASRSINAQDRDFNLPGIGGQFVTTLGINVITPFGAASPNGATRNPMIPTTRDYLDLTWPDGSLAHCALPQYYAMITQNSIIVGPWPDQGYLFEVIGTIRPTPLSAGNATTFLSQYLPDLFLAASMVFVAGWMKDYGSQGDDPQLAQSWETQTGKLMASAQAEEMRKKYMGTAWTSLSAAPQANPPRA